MARRVIVDSWAFIEGALEGPRRDEVEGILQTASKLSTVRDVVMETYSFLVSRGGGSFVAEQWLHRLKSSGVRVHDPRFTDLEEFYTKVPKGSGLSLVDISVAWAASREKTVDILTADRGFRTIGLLPLCASDSV